jgi:zinc transporter ZupT
VSQTLVAGVVLVVVHVSWGWLPRLRSVLLSAGSGVSIAYVFLHLLPEVAATQDRVEEEVAGGVLGAVESHAWIVALAGLALIYVVEVVSRRSRRGREDDGRVRGTASATSPPVGWVSIATYTVYNAVIGYLLFDQLDRGKSTLWLFTLAMAVHFAVNDHGLREHHGALYERVGRWLVSAGVLLGWVVGAFGAIPELAIGATVAFLAGGVVMNVMKEELPEDRQARVVPFLAGALAYGLLLLTL